MTQQYADEATGQRDFFKEFGIDPDEALLLHTDGVHNGNLLEFKTHISDVNQVLFQAIKYLSRLRINGRNVPATILLVDLNSETVYKFDSKEYVEDWHKVFTSAASRENKGFQAKSAAVTVTDYFGAGAAQVAAFLKENEFIPVRINEDCVVAWAERFYREVKGSDKIDLLNNDRAKGPLGELKDPRHFKGLIHPYDGDSYAEFSHILDRLNAKLQKIELGAFYTPEQYVLLSHRLLRDAIARVPAGNDYIIVDRCAGSGNLLRGLTEDELSHVIANTYEQFEYLELAREYGQRVRAVIPPTYKSGDPKYGMLLNGDALSDRFLLGLKNKSGQRVPNIIQEHIDKPDCTIILFENPPYADTSGMEAQKESRRSGGRASFGWKSSYVREQMVKELPKSANGSTPSKEISNVFIWSAFRYYLRQSTDSLVVFSPAKYFNQHHLVTKRFVSGFLVNRRHFHATKDAGITVVLWANEDEPGRTEWPLEMYDVAKDGSLLPGARKAGWEASGNIEVNSAGIPVVTIHAVTKRLSTLFDRRVDGDEERSVVCTFDGKETDRKALIKPLRSTKIIGYLVAEKMSFDNTDLATVLTRVPVYNGTGGFHLRSDTYMTKLPLFAVGRYPSEGRFWVRGVVNRNADNGDNFSQDRNFLKACLLFTVMAHHNKCRSLTGSDGYEYRNELCLDGSDTQASRDLAKFTLTTQEKALVAQFDTVLAAAKSTANYDVKRRYGPYQINEELNTRQRVRVGARLQTVYDYPVLNGELKTLKALAMKYHADVIAPKLWEYALLK